MAKTSNPLLTPRELPECLAQQGWRRRGSGIDEGLAFTRQHDPMTGDARIIWWWYRTNHNDENKEDILTYHYRGKHEWEIDAFDKGLDGLQRWNSQLEATSPDHGFARFTHQDPEELCRLWATWLLTGEGAFDNDYWRKWGK